MIELRHATRKAVEYACKNFHYAKCVPAVTHAYNVYENGNWCGVILYSSGATPHIATPFGMVQGEVLELVRVALNGKQTATSECVAATLRQLHKDAPTVKLVVSYADIDQEHVGTIYQATNWLYLGDHNRNERGAFIVHGVKMHPKSVHSKGWKQSLQWLRDHVDPNAQEFITQGKRKYIFVFNKRLRKEWAAKSKPYPKKGGDSNGKYAEPSPSEHKDKE